MWSIYDFLWPLFEVCSDGKEFKVLQRLTQGVQAVFINPDTNLPLTLCPTPTMDWLLIAATLGVLVFAIGISILIVYGIERYFLLMLALFEWFGSISHNKSVEPTFDEIMQQLNKAAEEYIKQSKAVE